jgi:hypothetical protein
MGFVRFEETGDAKASKTPRLAFKYTQIDVRMPQVMYSHHLGGAA